MTRILDGVKAGDPVIVVSSNIGPDGLRRTVRSIERVTKVFTHVLQTESMSGVQIATGRTPWNYGCKAVAPANDADVAEVLREIEERGMGPTVCSVAPLFAYTRSIEADVLAANGKAVP